MRLWTRLLAAALPLFACPTGLSAETPPPVKVTLKVYDGAGTPIVNATKMAAPHSNAFDVLRKTVQVEFTTYAGLGAFVTEIAGVQPGDKKYWALYVDGKFSTLGISNITIEKDMLIEWKMGDVGSHPREGQKVRVTAKVMAKDGKKLLRDHVIEYTVRAPALRRR